MKYFIITFFFISQMYFCVYAQNRFDQKKHTDTSLKKASFSARVIKGSTTSANASLTNSKSSLQPLSKQSTEILNREFKGNTQLFRSPITGLPIFISKKNTSSNQLRSSNSSNVSFAVYNYLTEISTLLELTHAEDQFVIFKIEVDPLGGQIIRLKQQFEGKEIDGCESILHMNMYGEIISWNGSYIKPERIHTKAFPIQASVAIQNALTRLQKDRQLINLSEEEKSFLNYTAPIATSVFYIDDKITRTCVPAYIIEIRPNFIDWWEYVIDATTGNVLSAHSKTCHIDGPRTSSGLDLNEKTQNINTYQKGSHYYTVDASRSMFNTIQSKMPDNPVGAIQTLNLNNTWGKTTKFNSISSNTNTFNRTTISAHTIASKSYEYFLQTHNRNSIDGKGGTIISFINVVDPEDGTLMDNAFWNGKAMYYGNGDSYFKPLAGGLDVGGHELTHGVIQNSANLTYQGESGALNESFADIFGCSIDPEDWQIGEDVVLLSEYPSGALRDLSDPHNGTTNKNSGSWQPKHVSEKYTGLEDNGGVHINSGIPNYAYYLFAQATQRSVAEKIFYRALTMYLTRSSQFIDLRIACLQAATDLYSANSNEVLQIGLAFDAVGISQNSGSPVVITTNEYPVNPGTEYLLAYNLNTAFSKKIIKITNSNNQQKTINSLAAFSKPSVTDDGSEIFYINTQNQIVYLSVNPTAIQEKIIEDEQIWNSLAISKDGNRLAVTTLSNDTTIYVYDFISEDWGAFTLYNPTFTEGIKSGGPIYADALEWDHTGQYLVYDCYNEFVNNSGDNISFWDINFIDVWNGNLNDFGAGTITKLFPSLEDGISVGNPTFAKNSSAIIAFDYVDEITSTIIVVACNTEKNELNAIVQTNELGFPSFNNTDTKLAYTYNTGFTANTSSIWSIDLNIDKISPKPNGNDILILKNSKWPLCFADGYRYIPTSTKSPVSTNTALDIYPNPCIENNVHITFSSTADTDGNIILTNTLGQIILKKQIPISTGKNDIELPLPSEAHAGYYIIQVESEKVKWAGRLIKL